MFITGPEVIKAVTGKVVTMEEVGGADMHAAVSGNVHFLAEDDARRDRHRAEIAVLPARRTIRKTRPTGRPRRYSLAEDDESALSSRMIRRSRWTCAPSSSAFVDPGEFLEAHRWFAENLIVGFGRIEGMVVGMVANQPAVKAGALDIDAADKGARFIRFCNAFNIPLVTLVDVPGFLPGVEQERGGIIRHGAKLLFAYASCTVPKITVILRKAYGGSYIAMCSREMGADFVFAWPTAEIAVMGAEGAIKVLYQQGVEGGGRPEGQGGGTRRRLSRRVRLALHVRRRRLRHRRHRSRHDPLDGRPGAAEKRSRSAKCGRRRSTATSPSDLGRSGEKR